MLVAANPEHPGTSLPVPHMICVAAGCAGVVARFGVELITGGGLAGLAERVSGAAQALWLLAVVASCRHGARKGTMPSLDYRSGKDLNLTPDSNAGGW
jgi:hypothetical protein